MTGEGVEGGWAKFEKGGVVNIEALQKMTICIDFSDRSNYFC